MDQVIWQRVSKDFASNKNTLEEFRRWCEKMKWVCQEEPSYFSEEQYAFVAHCLFLLISVWRDKLEQDVYSEWFALPRDHPQHLQVPADYTLFYNTMLIATTYAATITIPRIREQLQEWLSEVVKDDSPWAAAKSTRVCSPRGGMQTLEHRSPTALPRGRHRSSSHTFPRTSAPCIRSPSPAFSPMMSRSMSAAIPKSPGSPTPGSRSFSTSMLPIRTMLQPISPTTGKFPGSLQPRRKLVQLREGQCV